MPIKRVQDGRDKQDAGNARVYRDLIKGELWVKVDMGVGIGENKRKTSVVIAEYVGFMDDDYREWIKVRVVRVKPSTMQRVREDRERWEREKREAQVGKKRRAPKGTRTKKKRLYWLFEGEKDEEDFL